MSLRPSHDQSVAVRERPKRQGAAPTRRSAYCSRLEAMVVTLTERGAFMIRSTRAASLLVTCLAAAGCVERGSLPATFEPGGAVAGGAGDGGAGAGGTAGLGAGGQSANAAGGAAGTTPVSIACGFGGASATATIPPHESKYHLVQRDNFASPLPDPTGITHDGVGFWLIAGGHNSSQHTLVRFNPATGVTDRTFTFTNLIESLGTGVYGITWDGTSIWISVSGNTNKLVVVDPVTGMITRTMSSPTVLGPSDLEFDGTNLWLSSGTGVVFLISPKTGGILRQFSTSPASSGRDQGVALRPGELWIGNLFGGMEIHDPATGALVGTATHDNGCDLTSDDVGPSCVVHGQLAMISRFGVTIFDMTP